MQSLCTFPSTLTVSFDLTPPSSLPQRKSLQYTHFYCMVESNEKKGRKNKTFYLVVILYEMILFVWLVQALCTLLYD